MQLLQKPDRTVALIFTQVLRAQTILQRFVCGDRRMENYRGGWLKDLHVFLGCFVLWICQNKSGSS